MTPRRRKRTRYETPLQTLEPAPIRAPAAEPIEPSEPEEPAPVPSLPTSRPEAVQPAVGDGTPSATTRVVPALAAGEGTVPASDAPSPRRSRRRRVAGFFFVLGLALAAFATGLIVFNSLVMPRLIHGIGEVEVPDVQNLTLEQAEQALGPVDLQLSRAGERFDPVVPRGFILSQDPAPGTAVRGRRRVSVVVSLGEEFSSVPELFGESQRSAEQLLRSAGLRLGAITRAPSDEVGEGQVAGSDPGPESVLPQASTVSLLISTGSRQESFVMPDVTGLEIGRVRRQLEAYGFRVASSGGGIDVGTIVSQRPPAGSRITSATTIALQATGRVIR